MLLLAITCPACRNAEVPNAPIVRELLSDAVEMPPQCSKIPLPTHSCSRSQAAGSLKSLRLLVDCKVSYGSKQTQPSLQISDKAFSGLDSADGGVAIYFQAL